VVNNRLLIRVMSMMHRCVYRASGGRIGGSVGKAPVLLLTTTGRKTGKQRTTPVLYLRDDDRFVIVASNAGDAKNPAWWANLKATPLAHVRVRSTSYQVRARQATPAERARLWPRLVDNYPTYEDYVKRTDRELPVVILERAGDA
jgi:F420H(2)-dependent quinone reductase